MKKSELSKPRQNLVQLMQELGFGRVEFVRVQQGEPVLEGLRTKTEIKLGSQCGPRPESVLQDFSLRAEVIQLCTVMDEIRDGVIESISVKHGLPFLITVDGSVSGR